MTSLTTIDPHLKIELCTTKENGVRSYIIHNMNVFAFVLRWNNMLTWTDCANEYLHRIEYRYFFVFEHYRESNTHTEIANFLPVKKRRQREKNVIVNIVCIWNIRIARVRWTKGFMTYLCEQICSIKDSINF